MNQEIQKQLILGEYTKHAALIIQKNVKIFLLRRKLKRLKRVFENYYLKSTRNFLVVFTNTLFHWSSKYKIEKLKFCKYRDEKLSQIRKRLAILTIKSAIKNKVFCIYKGRRLIKRLSRKKKQLMNQRLSENIQEPVNNMMPLPNFEELMRHIENESLYDVEQREAERQMNLRKLAYNIKNFNEISLAPLLSKKYYINSSGLKSVPLPPTEIRKYRNLSISTPPLTTYKRMYMAGDLPSKLMCYPIKDPNIPQRPMSSHSHQVSEDMNFLRPTEVFIRKISVDPPLSDDSPKKKIRPPSKKLMRSTISSLAKKNDKKITKKRFGDFVVKTFDKLPGMNDEGFSKNMMSWRRYYISKSFALDRKENIV